jgi:hypothetical protein
VDVTVVWTAVAAVGTLAAAGVAAWAARQSRNSALEANAAAKSLAVIERDRRHDELTPMFDATLKVYDEDRAELKSSLSGGRLERLDDVTITILDASGRDHWMHGLPEGVTQQDAEAFIWGPYEFNTSAGDQILTNRQTRPRPYSRVSGRNWDLLPMVPTLPGHWMSSESDSWREEYRREPVRLLLTCRLDGHEPWLVNMDVRQPPLTPTSATA